MKQHHKHKQLPAIASAGSFLFLLGFTVLTSPVTTISYTIVFFSVLLIFLVSAGYFAVYLQNGKVRPRDRYRICIVSLLILIAVMLRSAQSLNFIDVVVLLLVGCGLLLYTGRRTN